MNLNDQYYESYVPVFDVIPDKWEDAKAALVEQLKKLGNAVNSREIGFFLDQELLSGKAFIPSGNISGGSSQYRTVLRKVVNFGSLPNNSAKPVPHGITFDANFTLIQMFASATDPTNLLALPIPFAAVPSANTPIQMFMDNTNIWITTSNDRSTYTRTYVVIEYIQEP